MSGSMSFSGIPLCASAPPRDLEISTHITRANPGMPNVFYGGTVAIKWPQFGEWTNPEAEPHKVDFQWRFEFQSGASASDERPNVRVAEFLGAVYAIDSWGNRRYAIKHVMDYLDGLLNSGQFDECDLAFRQAKVKKISPATIAAFLNITNAAKKRLPSRQAFYRNALAVVAEARGMDRAIDLLQRYS
jgi:hypothetical protein